MMMIKQNGWPVSFTDMNVKEVQVINRLAPIEGATRFKTELINETDTLNVLVGLPFYSLSTGYRSVNRPKRDVRIASD
jgi:hypothetical protein